MEAVYFIGLILVLNSYILLVISLSRCKNRVIGLLAPVVMLFLSFINAVEYSQLVNRTLNSPEGISLICSLILAIFGFILYIITRFDDNKGTK